MEAPTQPFPGGVDMEIRQLRSSAISRAGFDAQTGVLRIWFTSDPAQGYDFFRVPPAVWQGLLSAPSAGRYFHAHIEKQYAAR
ncbi:KTSC domain-containing protein [Comamonas thiooxydans]|uniref:KTSC domain-containing protein n=2 Tax=Comamonas thiooxydans TaxID=363952 RepID=UPI003D15FB43